MCLTFSLRMIIDFLSDQLTVTFIGISSPRWFAFIWYAFSWYSGPTVLCITNISTQLSWIISNHYATYISRYLRRTRDIKSITRVVFLFEWLLLSQQRMPPKVFDTRGTYINQHQPQQFQLIFCVLFGRTFLLDYYS